jgi:predicted PurR-regulated permease PerM
MTPAGERLQRADTGFASRVLAALGLTLLVAVVALVVAQAIDVILLSFLALLLALGLRDAAAWLSRRVHLPRSASLVAVLTVLVAAIWAMATLAAPSVAAQGSELARALPEAFGRAQERLSDREWGRWVLQQLPPPAELTSRTRALLGRAPGVFSATFGVLANLLVVVTLVLFLAFQLDVYRDGFLRLVPPRRRERAAQVLDELGRTLSLWLIGRVVAMLLITVLTTIGLWVIGVPLALLLALIAGLLNFIPNIGPIAALAPAALLAVVQGPSAVLWTVVLYTGIQVVESYVLTPYIQQKAIDMPPALLILTQVLLGVLLGFLGLLLATPLTAAVIVLVRRLYVEDFLERGAAA